MFFFKIDTNQFTDGIIGLDLGLQTVVVVGSDIVFKNF